MACKSSCSPSSYGNPMLCDDQLNLQAFLNKICSLAFSAGDLHILTVSSGT